MSAQPGAAPADGGSVSSRFMAAMGCGDCCADCWPRTGLFTRVLMVEGLLGLILGAFGLSAYTASCPSLIIASGGVQFYRLLLSPLISSGIISGAFALFTVWQLAVRMESSLGTVRFGHLFLTLLLGTNLVIFVIGVLLGSLAGVTFFTLMCATGLWPAVFGLMAIDCMAQPEAPRRICPCLPWEIAAKYHPWIMLLLFSLMMRGIDFGMFFGLMLGYAFHYRQELTLSLHTATRWEQKPCFMWIGAQEGFAPASGGGVSAGGEGAWSEASREANAPPSRFRSVHDPPSSSSSGAPPPPSTAPSVFAGTGGHRLGGANDPPPSSSVFSSITRPFSSSSSRGGGASATSGDTTSVADARAAAEARNQRLAAIEARMSKGGAKASSPRSSATATAIPSPPPSYDRPPSPSITPGQQASSTGVFSIGGEDSDDDIYAEDDEGVELTALPSSSTAASATSSSNYAHDEQQEDEPQQGFLQAKGKGKGGYAQVGPPGGVDDDDGLDLEAGSDVDSDERTNLTTPR